MRWDQVSVECFSGYRTNERPVAFAFHERRWEVAEIIFLLRYHFLFDSWSIQAYKDSASVIGVC